MLTLRRLFAMPVALAMAAGASAATIRDDAKIFSPAAVQKAQAALEEAERASNVPVTIETIDSLGGADLDAATLDRAKLDAKPGLFILIAAGDKKMEVREADAFKDYISKPRRLTIREAFSAQFKSGDYDAGLAAGVQQIGRVLDEARADFGGPYRPSTAARGRAPAPARGMPVGRPAGMSSWLGIGMVVLGIFLVLRIISSIFGANRGYAGGPGRMGAPGYGAPGYGAPGYGGGGGGGGFMSSMFGGIGGALAGNWLYDQFSGRHHGSSDAGVFGGTTDAGADVPQQETWSGGEGEGASWGDAGGDAGGGGDWGGGGGDVGGGGDWGGGGGGDWGGGGGGGDGGGW